MPAPNEPRALIAGAAISKLDDPLEAGVEAAGGVAAMLQGADADLALVFASGGHVDAPEALLDGVLSALAPNALVGCGAEGVLGDGRELESETAVAVWAASLGDGGQAQPFHASVVREGSQIVLDGLPELDGATGAIMLSDPYFPTDAALTYYAQEHPGVPVLGGLSSGATRDGDGPLLFAEHARLRGAVGVTLRGVEMLPCVSQGAAPLGREVTITSAERNVIHELAGRPALETVERIIAELPPHQRALVAAGLLIGLVIDGGKPEYEQGDFLVRGVLGADPDKGSLVVGASVREGQVVRLQARDARSADEDLRRALRLHTEAMAGDPPAGALLFSCNGRGRAMFGVPDHDARTVQREFAGAPAAGFFAAGEIGPVGGRSFLHGFTATLAVFPA
jgi:small ligand-binding sensory domain FIST